MQAVCPTCQKEVNPNKDSNKLGNHLLHQRCYKEVLHKIHIMLENKWEKSNKLDAYFDLLRIEKEIRPAIKEILKKSRGAKKEELV